MARPKRRTDGDPEDHSDQIRRAVTACLNIRNMHGTIITRAARYINRWSVYRTKVEPKIGLEAT